MHWMLLFPLKLYMSLKFLNRSIQKLHRNLYGQFLKMVNSIIKNYSSSKIKRVAITINKEVCHKPVKTLHASMLPVTFLLSERTEKQRPSFHLLKGTWIFHLIHKVSVASEDWCPFKETTFVCMLWDWCNKGGTQSNEVIGNKDYLL